MPYPSAGGKPNNGTPGPMGAQGLKGDTGPAGPKGDTGEVGPTGYTGAQGPAGAKGDAGVTGESGAKGDKGDVGATGPKGDTGNTGAKGDKGIQGDTGAIGPAGPKGDTGATGSAGAIGPQGLQGVKGDTGLTGTQGLKGDTGAAGSAGANGISYTPQAPVARTVTPATAYQHTDVTKPYKVIVNARSTQTVTVAGFVSDKVELRIGATAASVAAGATGGLSIGVWESGITGIALMVGAAVLDGGQISADVPAGWYFSVNRLTGTNATIVSCFTQSLTP
ncbi:MAG: hypothetical protein [Caudoviricetes sp.]|nr:MAG: hypothetical protein [Caudoviricetes sp.]